MFTCKQVAPCLSPTLVLLLAGADRDDAIPATARTTDDIIGAAEKVKGNGYVQTAEFHRWGKRIFAVWYCPFSGRGDCYLNVYGFDHDAAQWTRLEGRLVPSNGDLAVELPSRSQAVLIHDGDGKLVLKVPINEVGTKPRGPATRAKA